MELSSGSSGYNYKKKKDKRPRTTKRKGQTIR
jgi:hypothetical protein